MAPLNPHAPRYVPAVESPFAPAVAPLMFPVSYAFGFPYSYSLPQPFPEVFPLPPCCYYHGLSPQPQQSQLTHLSSICYYPGKDARLAHGCPGIGIELSGVPFSWPSSWIVPTAMPVLPSHQVALPLLHSPIAPAGEGVLRPPIYSPQPEVILEVIPKIRHGSDKRLPPPRAICLRKRRVRIGPRWRTKMDSSGGRVRRGPKRSFSCRVGSFWLPKLRCLRKKCPDEDKLQENLQFTNGEDADDGGDSRTTVMIKNLPNKMRKEALLTLLDSHCQKENGKVVHHDAVMNTRSQFDFFYLPMDFGTGSNLGYAFVNFTSAAGALRFHRAFHQMKWSIMGSRKVCEVTYARIQGLTALMKHFRGSVFVCDNDELLPLYFVPHRDGVMQCEGHHVGRRVPPSRFGGP